MLFHFCKSMELTSTNCFQVVRQTNVTCDNDNTFITFETTSIQEESSVSVKIEGQAMCGYEFSSLIEIKELDEEISPDVKIESDDMTMRMEDEHTNLGRCV